MRMALSIGLGAMVVVWGVALAQSGGGGTWDFQRDTVSSPPAGFSFGRTGQGREGKWVVLTDASAPAGDHVLAQTDMDGTDYRFPGAVADAPEVKDLRLEVRCKPVERKGRRGVRTRLSVQGPGQLLRRASERPRGQREPLSRGGRAPTRDQGLERQGHPEHVAQPRHRGARGSPAGLLGGEADHRRQGRHVPRRREGGPLDQGRFGHLLRRPDRDTPELTKEDVWTTSTGSRSTRKRSPPSVPAGLD